MSGFQANLLRDGELTFPEYQEAMQGMVQCLRDNGIQATDPELQPNRTFAFSTPNPAPENLESFQAAFADCNQEYLSVVELEWADANAPSQEETEAFYQKVIDCLAEKNIQVVSTESEDLNAALDAHPAEYNQCLSRVAEQEMG